VRELREAIATSSIIEDYPEDKYGPSCLVLVPFQKYSCTRDKKFR